MSGLLASALMVRRRVSAVSNHELVVLVLRDAAKWPLLRTRASYAQTAIMAGLVPAIHALTTCEAMPCR